MVALYNTISSKVNDAMKSMPNDSVWIEQIKEYAPLTKKICILFGDLDAQSYSFRFPVDENGNAMNVPFNNVNIKDILEIIQEIDPYVSCSLSLLKKYGFIEACDKEDYQTIFN